MSLTERMMSQIQRTQTRYQQQAAEREASRGAVERGDIASANSLETLRKRGAILDLKPSVFPVPGTRSAGSPPCMTEGMDTRGIVEVHTLERVLGKNDLMPIVYLLRGLQRARCVGRVHIKDAQGVGQGFGTGSMISPRLMMTNNHVLASEQDAVFSEIEFDFEVDLANNVRKTVKFGLDPKAFFITDNDLDFTMVAVVPKDGREPREWGWNLLSEKEGHILKGEYVSIIQHPNGEAKQIAMRENKVVDLLDNFTHYHTDTAPGSSGSPVFNDQWELVALHHSGVPERRGNDIIAVDGQVWQSWMGDHRIKWIANEGIFSHRICRFLKNATDFNASQKQLRDQLFSQEPPSPTFDLAGNTISLAPKSSNQAFAGSAQSAAGLTTLVSGDSASSGVGGTEQSSVAQMPTSSGVATWTIPLQISISVGQPVSGTPTMTPPISAASTVSAPLPAKSSLSTSTPPTSMAQSNDDLQKALAEADQARNRTYYDEPADEEDRDNYYESIHATELSEDDLFHELGDLLKTTHKTKPSYSPSVRLYPWVDLHPDLKLRSIYSGKGFTAEELIREDFRIQAERTQMLKEITLRESTLSPDQMQEEFNLLESQNPFNCEHTVPQSWFAKKEPMRGDLHHLFACESGCNSFRRNIPYFDFTDFEEKVRTECGRAEDSRFEPSSGKGPVARATLYFLLRYPGLIDASEFPADRIGILLNWHQNDAVSDYELHRNQAIFQVQGNRNPLIDWPEWAKKINFALGLG